MAETLAVRSRLRRSWTPFFGRFGALLPVQLQAIPPILDGASVVVASPTASGKTEAVVAPVAERAFAERWAGLSVVYVVPTRALANDTLSRIAGPLQEMGFAAALKHGDSPALPRSAPDLLITTPESLDSLICRSPRLMSTVSTVILDEIHLLDGTYRGDQLRVLLGRIRQELDVSPLTVHLLSATLADPGQIASRYVADATAVVVSGQRQIEHWLVSSLEDVYQLARRQRWRKLLLFCNTRESVESAAGQLAPLWRPYPVVAHHASLSRRVRQEAETVMRENDVAACVATSTLEVGIDIGDIDVIVLADLPWSVSSLLQRIGRGCRRVETTRVVAIVSSPEQREVLEAMLRVAASGALPTEDYRPDPTVAVQQSLSSLFQQRAGLSTAALVDLLSPLVNDDEVSLILAHLEAQGWVEQAQGRWHATTRTLDLGETGRLHSNIADAPTRRVVDADSGREVGFVSDAVDHVFLLGQRAWQVVKVGQEALTVRRFHGEAATPVFIPHRRTGAFYHLLPPSLRHRADG